MILGSNQEVEVEKNELQEKDEIAILPTDQAQTLDEKNAVPIDPAAAAARAKVVQAYGFRPEEDAIAPRADIDLIMDKILETSDERATAILADAIVEHAGESYRDERVNHSKIPNRRPQLPVQYHEPDPPALTRLQSCRHGRIGLVFRAPG